MTTVAVVGGGASPKNRALGQAIDAADVVVRMFDHRWELDNPKDYGRRWDVGFFIVNPGPAFQRWQPRGKTTPSTWWGALALDQFKDMLPIFNKRGSFRLFDATGLSPLSVTLTKDAGPRPVIARGVLAVLAALEFLQPRSIRLYGFDNLVAGKITASATKTEPINMGRRRLGRWDPVNDANLLRHLTAKADTSLEFFP